MQITLNGTAHECVEGTTVDALLTETGYANRRVAVEVNQSIVPRSQYAKRILQPGDRIEIVHAIGGG